MKLRDAHPGDVVVIDDPREGPAFYAVCTRLADHRAIKATKARTKRRRGDVDDADVDAVIVDRLDVDTLRPIPFADGRETEMGTLGCDVEVELIASVDLMRRARYRRAVATLADGEAELEVDPLQRMQAAAAQVGMQEWRLENPEKDIPF